MPTFPQPVYKFSSGLDANTSPGPGDVLVFVPTAARIVTLPNVSTGGPVTVKLQGKFGAGFGVTINPATGDGSTIDGFTSILLNNAGDEITIASDNTNWWSISKYHNTHDTY